LKARNLQLLASEVDNAGMNILKFLNPILQEKASTIKGESIFADEEISHAVKADQTDIIFLSRHRAKSLRPSLTVHPIGNFGKAEFGGKDDTLISCNSFLLKQLFLNMVNLNNSEKYKLEYTYELSLEVTHHGPPSPLIYIEVGSSPTQWDDLEACRLIADAVNITDFDNLYGRDNWISCIGFGGNHYAMKFTSRMRDTDYAIGHICAKYAIPFLTVDLIEQMIQKTYPRPKLALFDKKSMKRKQEIRVMLSDFDIEVVQI
ncbi:MAG: D-aminoacyl-tRNA deacylase, partial [Candidatus Hodarchaeales archaeon]